MKLSLIYARSENRVIGKAGGLPWRLPDDFAHFKRTTMGHPIVMGRRTYEDHQTALAGRTNIVVSSRPDYQAAEGVIVRPSIGAALEPYRGTDEEIFISGGGTLYAQMLPYADRVFETIVHGSVAGDTRLPPFDLSRWQRTLLQEHPPDDRHAMGFTVLRFDRP
jgi:dihydrofolate reductase